MSTTSAEEEEERQEEWPSFPVMVKREWLVKPSGSSTSCSRKLQSSDTDIMNGELPARFNKIPLTGFDICRVRLGFMERLLVFNDHHQAAAGGGGGGGATVGGVAVEPAIGEDRGLRLGVTLRENLAKALEDCYPFAGRLMREEDGTFAIDCNDAGVLFVEASSPISVEELRDDRLLHSYENFCPLDRSNIQEIGSLLDFPLFAVQLTTFDNGGYAIGIMFCHGIADGPCAWQFVSSWAQVCRGEKQISHSFDFSSRANLINLMPHSSNSETTTFMELPQTWKKCELLSHGVFLLYHGPHIRPAASKHLFLRVDPDLVKKLKSQLAQEDDQDTHTDATSVAAGGFSSYVAISALLWRASVRARNIPDLQDSRFIAAIDCRKRCNNLPNNYFGNAILDAVSVANVGELLCRQRISFAAKTIRSSLQELMSDDSIQSFSNMMEQEKQCGFNAKFRQETDVFAAGMIHNPLLACDFGSGIPCCIKFDVLHLCNNFLLWCPKAKPSDAWVLIFKAAPDVADRMLQDPELMAFMTLDYAR